MRETARPVVLVCFGKALKRSLFCSTDRPMLGVNELLPTADEHCCSAKVKTGNECGACGAGNQFLPYIAFSDLQRRCTTALVRVLVFVGARGNTPLEERASLRTPRS